LNAEATAVPALETLFARAFRERPRAIEALKPDGSSRRVFRLRGERRTVVGVHHESREENAAFIGFARHFRALGLPVPEILAVDEEGMRYLETDLGDESLASRTARAREAGTFSESAFPAYREAVGWLARFQVLGRGGIDTSLCYQGTEFDARAVERDLAYFRECFLGLLSTRPFDPAALEADFGTLAGFLGEEDRSAFLYRDFQSRNILLAEGKTFFIDFQSGRLGAPEYDLASLLYEARARLDEEVRSRLLGEYLGELERLVPVDRARFLRFFPAFALVRILQALGAYGNLGVRQGKRWFLEGVAPALANVRSLLLDPAFPLSLPEIERALVPPAEDPRLLRMPSP
jgi:aminoglycoside/choline kinase family phosphotransferase